jgi:hypothetical protein
MTEFDPKRRSWVLKYCVAASPDLMLANPLCCHFGQGQRMQFDRLRRRDVITLIGGAAACPMAAKGQPAVVPLIAVLSSTSHELDEQARLPAFRAGLKEAGYVQGQNVAVEFRWAEDRYDRLPSLAADLVRYQPAVIATLGGTTPALAANPDHARREAFWHVC